jgi:site-specific DNA recombinase
MTGLQQSGPRAAIYCRVSSKGQELDGTSLETQESACTKYAADHGYALDEGRIYREIHTGADLHERRRLAALRSAVRDELVDVVVCYSVDRLTRNQAHLYIVAEELEDVGARLEFVTESFGRHRPRLLKLTRSQQRSRLLVE